MTRVVRRRTVRRLVTNQPAYRHEPFLVIQLRLTSPFDDTAHVFTLRPGERRAFQISALVREIMVDHPAVPGTLVSVPMEVSARVA